MARALSDEARPAPRPTGPLDAIARWWCRPVPRARVAWLRTFAYAFVWIDVLLTTSWVGSHGDVDGSLYQPLRIGRLLELPTPTPALRDVVFVALLATSAAAVVLSRWQRVLGVAVAVLYLEWMVLAFSYGKVDHDRFAYLVLLAVLPTVGRARRDDQGLDEGAGWAVRVVQVAVVATYFLSSWAKLRFGGLAWVDSATLLRAVLRRGTELGDVLGRHPWTLHATQYGIVLAELGSPLLLVGGRLQRVGVAVAYLFHLVVFLTVRIIFLPHLVAMLAFLPLERLGRRRRGEPAAAT